MTTDTEMKWRVAEFVCSDCGSKDIHVVEHDEPVSEDEAFIEDDALMVLALEPHVQSAWNRAANAASRMTPPATEEDILRSWGYDDDFFRLMDELAAARRRVDRAKRRYIDDVADSYPTAVPAHLRRKRARD